MILPFGNAKWLALNCAFHPLAGFANRSLRQPDHREARQSAGQLRLDDHFRCVDAALCAAEHRHAFRTRHDRTLSAAGEVPAR